MSLLCVSTVDGNTLLSRGGSGLPAGLEDGVSEEGRRSPAGSAGFARHAAGRWATISTPRLETSNPRAPRTPGAPEHHAGRHFTPEQHGLPVGLASHRARPGASH